MRRRSRTALVLSFALAAIGSGGGAVVSAQSGPDAQVPARFTATLGAGRFDEQTVTTTAAFEASDARQPGHRDSG